MTIISLADGCRLLAIDPKTLRRWLDLAHVPLLPHASDARIKGLLLPPVPVSASASQEEPATVVVEPAPVPATPRSRPTTSSSAKRRRAPARVLPLVEYATHGGYVIICPEHGLLTFEPDTPQWFAWLATRSSFRFVGKHGRLTAHRELQRVPGGAWRAHRQLRNRSYTSRLGSTESLTIAALEQVAAELQAHLA